MLDQVVSKVRLSAFSPKRFAELSDVGRPLFCMPLLDPMLVSRLMYKHLLIRIRMSR